MGERAEPGGSQGFAAGMYLHVFIQVVLGFFA